jgi:hypothetical protein
MFALIAACAACEQDTSQSSSSPVARASGGHTAAIDCRDLDLRTPAGDRIDLNGTWETEREGTRAGVYFFRQIGACVWFSGGYPSADDLAVDGPLGFLSVVFRGRVATDFTISGEWADVRTQARPTSAGQWGTLQLTIESDESGMVRLVYAGGDGQPFIEPGYREEQSWIKISDGGAYPPPN